MSFYSVPDDMMSGKNWNQMLTDNMKALGMPDMPMPEFAAPGFKMPLMPAPKMSAAMAENTAALALMPFGMAASLMGALAGPWAAAMDGAIAATRQMAAMTPPMPDFIVPSQAVATGEVVAFAPKPKPAKAPKATKPEAQPAVSDVAIASLEAVESPAAPLESVAVPASAHAVSPAIIEAPAAIIEAVAPTVAPKPVKGGLLDLVAVDDVQLVEEAVLAPVAETTTVLSPEDFKRPVGISRPEALDDLKMISGVGPKIEGILHGLGIYTFAQVASWNAAEIAWVDDYLNFKGRITRDDWIAQADALATGGRDEYVKRFGKEPR